MRSEHEHELEFNCMECSFQGYSEKELNKHRSIAHLKVNREKRTPDNNLPCHSCGIACNSKWSLMNHRRDNHTDILKMCSHYLKGTCVYENDVCWYRHGANKKDAIEFKCSFCEHIFKRKHELMMHRKDMHTESNMFKCRAFQKGLCRNKENECWYNHDEKSVNDTEKDVQTPVFQKAQDNPHPPDMMERMMSIMEKLMKKVEILESIAQIDQ
jgi:hypothetical protein